MSKVYEQFNSIASTNSSVVFGGGGGSKKKKKKKSTSVYIGGHVGYVSQQPTSQDRHDQMSIVYESRDRTDNTNIMDTAQHITHHAIKGTTATVNLNPQSGLSLSGQINSNCTSCHNVSDPYANQ